MKLIVILFLITYKIMFKVCLMAPNKVFGADLVVRQNEFYLIFGE